MTPSETDRIFNPESDRSKLEAVERQGEIATRSIDDLNSREGLLQDGERSQQRYLYWASFSSASLVIVGGAFLVQRLGGVRDRYFGTLSLVCLLAALALLVTAFAKFEHVRALRDERQDLSFERDLLRYHASPPEGRAEKLLSINQYQLRRYHELNLTQGRWVFLLGVLCLSLGFGVIGVTLYLLQEGQQGQNQLVVGAVGTVGGIMTNFVGALYLKMYGEISNSLREFHKKLVATHELFLANLLSSRMTDEVKRTDNLGQLALAIANKVK